MTLIMVDNTRWFPAVEPAVFYEFLHRSLQHSLRRSADASREPGESICCIRRARWTAVVQVEKKKIGISRESSK